MHQLAKKEDRITVISNNSKFHFRPSNPWVALDWRTRDDIELEIEPLVTRKNIDLIVGDAKRVHPDHNQVELDDGRNVDYDQLVIATGPKLAFDASGRTWPGR